MTCTETLALREPLRDVHLIRPGEPEPEPAIDWDAHVREAGMAGYERGRLDGEKALSEQLLRQRNEMLQMHQGVIESLRQAVPGLIRQTEGALISLALEAARRLVAGMPVSPEMIEAVVRDAIAQVEEGTEFFIYLHPEDLAQLKQVNSPLLTPVAGGDKLCFHASGDVTRGGCLVQTRFGVLDARRDTKLEQLKKSLGLAETATAPAP